ncbi:MAG: TetR/AcrR family transcriptional regulator [Cyanobacteria bacterium REEB67]|nr:TetR/AcrR family transcriptional regulator [Cyanobacteria bacterium REEB67]
MGRPKNFSREEVLEKAIVLFWHRGFADTSLQDLEKATGVNKSGLYSEFRDKNDIFLASLRYYLANRDLSALFCDPPGLQNIAIFFNEALLCTDGPKGCLAVNSLRELAVVPGEAREIISRSQTQLKRGFARNINAAGGARKKVKSTVQAIDVEGLAELTMTFFIGISLEQNLRHKKTAAATRKKIDDLLALLSQA